MEECSLLCRGYSVGQEQIIVLTGIERAYFHEISIQGLNGAPVHQEVLILALQDHLFFP